MNKTNQNESLLSRRHKNIHLDRLRKVEEAKASLANDREQSNRDYSIDWGEIESK